MLQSRVNDPFRTQWIALVPVIAAIAVLLASPWILCAFSHSRLTAIHVNENLIYIILAIYFWIGARAAIALGILTTSLSSRQLPVVIFNHHESRLTGIIHSATDAIVAIDETLTVVLVNPSAAAMFGTTIEEMRGNMLEKYIPLRHSSDLLGLKKHFGNYYIPVLKIGKGHTHYDVTGVRINGEEFPIEASISSMVENNGCLYTLILRDVTDRKQAQEALARSHEELSRLSTALQSVREEERKNIARDLYDDLGQLLAALRIDLSLLQKQAMEASISPKQFVGMDELLTTSITSLRRIATELRPRALDEGGLYFALQTLCKDFITRYGIVCELQANENELVLNDQHSTAIFRIVQESLTNVFRHAHATRVILRFERDDTDLEINIQDNGRSIRSEDLQKNVSLSLVDMRERVRTMRGDIWIDSGINSETDRGTRIRIVLPILAGNRVQRMHDHYHYS